MAAYSNEFYEHLRAGSRSSAAVLVPIVLDLFGGPGQTPPGVLRVIDVGCGEGWWAREFRDRGCHVLGLDSAPDAGAALEDEQYRWCLLDRPFVVGTCSDLAGRWDLAVSLEVAEHLPPERGPSFVADLCRLAPLVLFSAAIPGQRGTDHINERWPDYWAGLFEDHGYHVTGALRWQIWEDDRVSWWYRQNLLVAADTASHLGPLADSGGPLRVVHPARFDASEERPSRWRRLAQEFAPPTLYRAAAHWRNRVRSALARRRRPPTGPDF